MPIAAVSGLLPRLARSAKTAACQILVRDDVDEASGSGSRDCTASAPAPSRPGREKEDAATAHTRDAKDDDRECDENEREISAHSFVALRGACDRRDVH